MAATTSEAYIWTRDGGLKQGGWVCEGAISPPEHVISPEDARYDVLVIGGGYAGLAACRDLTNAGQ